MAEYIVHNNKSQRTLKKNKDEEGYEVNDKVHAEENLTETKEENNLKTEFTHNKGKETDTNNLAQIELSSDEIKLKKNKEILEGELITNKLIGNKIKVQKEINEEHGYEDKFHRRIFHKYYPWIILAFGLCTSSYIIYKRINK